MIDSAASAVTIDEGSRLRAGPAASWSAIFCGAAVAISTSLVLLTLGAGLGFAALSASSFTIAGVIWVIVTQWISALLGGYITGRLRHRWLATHTHEVFFRDTAHGLVTWAVATLALAAFATGALSTLGGTSMHALAPVGLEVPTAAARKAAAQAAIYTGLAMLIGAFIASVSAAIGGRLRDEHL
jgi:hypothetical protein